MEYSKLGIMFQIIKNTLGVDAKLLSEDDYRTYRALLNKAGHNDVLGMAFNLTFTSSKILTPTLFNPENSLLLKEVIESSSQYPRSISTEMVRPAVFVNFDSAVQYHNNGHSTSFIKRELPGWSEYPLSLRTFMACIIVHELTHCQMDQDKYEDCSLHISCSHCREFFNRMQDNWIRIIEDDCLRKIDYAFYEISFPTFSSEL